MKEEMKVYIEEKDEKGRKMNKNEGREGTQAKKME